MDWSKGISSKFTMVSVDTGSWGDSGELPFSDGKIDRDASTSLRESASVTAAQDLGEQWVRIYLEASQEGSKERVALFTGITSSPERKFKGMRNTYSCDLYSVLKPANDVVLPRGYYAPSGSGADKIKELLSCGPAPIEVIGESPITISAIVAEDGETNLTMALAILKAINWRIRILGDGTIQICEPATTSSEIFGMNVNDVVSADTAGTDSFDWYDCPNCYRAISDDGAADARDDDPASALSTVNRGREVWTVEKSVDLSDSETIAEYAQRALKEAQSPARSLKYNRRFFPEVLCTDLIELDYPAHNLTGLYRVTSQSFDIDKGCETTEEVTAYE